MGVVMNSNLWKLENKYVIKDSNNLDEINAMLKILPGNSKLIYLNEDRYANHFDDYEPGVNVCVYQSITNENVYTVSVFCQLTIDDYYKFAKDYWRLSVEDKKVVDMKREEISNMIKATINSIKIELSVLKDFSAFFRNYSSTVFLKKAKYTFKDAKMSKDLSTVSLNIEETGPISIATYKLGTGIKGIMECLQKVTLNSEEDLKKIKEQLDKSLKLDICIVKIDMNKNDTSISFFDSKGKKKVSKGFMRYHGVNFFESLNTEYLHSENFYKIMREDSITAFDLRKTFKAGLLSRDTDGGYYFKSAQCNVKITEEEFEDVKQKYIDLVGEEEAYTQLLLLEVQEK